MQQNSQCCMVCSPATFTESSRLGIIEVQAKMPRKKRRIAVRKVSEVQLQVLESSLKAERASYIKEHPILTILGVQIVCPDSIIKKICLGVKCISSVNDMDNFCVRQELKQRFFNVIMLVVNS